jgi:hypothetical protein
MMKKTSEKGKIGLNLQIENSIIFVGFSIPM